MKVAVLGSTRGTDLQAIIDAVKAGDLDIDISVVISNKENALTASMLMPSSTKKGWASR